MGYKYFTFGFSILAILVFTTCGKSAVKADKDFIGNWSEERLGGNTCRLSISISSNGDAVSNSLSPTSDCRRAGTNKGTARLSGKTLRIGLRKFSIQESPTHIDTLDMETDFGMGKTVMRMTLDGTKLFKLIGK